MAKTLIVKGANYSTNKLDTVAFDTVPCTGISLDESTEAITSIGRTATITATVTPSNTTDTLTWSTSDSDVTTVADGVITAVGCGTATITATCGTQTATCAVTVSNIMIFAYSKQRFVDMPSSRLFARINTSQSGSEKFATAYSSQTLTGRMKVLDMVNYSTIYPILLSAGATKINFTIPSTHRVTVFFVDSMTQTSASGHTGEAAFISGDASAYDANVPLGSREVSIPSGADALVFTIQYSDGTVTDEMMTEMTAIES